MQTFLPFPNFKASVRVLDNKRLGKQRLEAYQILLVIQGKSKGKGWQNHPAVKMWVGYEKALKRYYNACYLEWNRRGFINNMEYLTYADEGDCKMPWWLGNKFFHKAMRARLIEKDEKFYGSKWAKDKGFNRGKYFWPVNETKTFRII